MEELKTGRSRAWHLFGRPGLATWLGLLPLAVGLLSWKTLLTADADLATHVRLGQDLLADGLPTGVPLLGGEGAAWSAATQLSAWAFEVIQALAYGAVGWAGPLLICALLLCAPFWLVAVRLRLGGIGFWGVLISVLAVLILSAHHVVGRPHLLSWAILVPYTALWRSWAEERHSDGRMALIVLPCTLIWANLHGGFLAGLVVAGLVVLGAGPSKWFRGGLLVAGCGFIACVNPWGPALYQGLFGFLSDRWLIEHTSDFRAVTLGDAMGLRTLVAVLFAGLGLALDRARRPVDLLLATAFSIFAFASVRNVPIAALVLVVPIAESWARVISGWAAQGSRFATEILASSKRTAPGHAFAGALWIPTFALVAALGMSGLGVPGWKLPSDKAPANAWEFVEAAKDELVFTDFMYGGFVVFWRGAAFIHPLNLLYPRDRGEDYVTVNQAEPGWREVLARHEIRWLLVRPDSAIAEQLRSEPFCSLRYEDALAVVAHCQAMRELTQLEGVFDHTGAMGTAEEPGA